MRAAGDAAAVRPGYRLSRFLLPLVLIPAADFLIFRYDAGLNLFLFVQLLALFLLLFPRKRLSSGAKAALAALSLATGFPLMEAVTWMSVLVGLAGLAYVSLASHGLTPARPVRIPAVLLRFVAALPVRLLRPARRPARPGAKGGRLAALGSRLRIWIAPLALAGVFLLLFAIANPLIEKTIETTLARLVRLPQALDAQRIGFWLAVGLFVHVLLRPRLLRAPARRNESAGGDRAGGDSLFGTAFLIRTLVLLNAVFAVQTGLDLTYLWGGARLPDGMSHAQYAHRGAYPLVVTALLAAALILAAMRPDGPGSRSPRVRRLVYLWIAQNALLCFSAMLRLDLYVETYSLTGLRLAAGLWMGLVATCLLLILLRIVLRRSNEWLVATGCASLAVVVFLGALGDAPGFIARFNVAHSRELSGQGRLLDLHYLSRLGASAIPALDTYIAAGKTQPALRAELAAVIRNRLAGDVLYPRSDWRGWTLRKARIRAYLLETAPIAR
ncbi:DUF4173 domain-containing protein [Rhizobiaceae bacterium BDR2-2]|uniref:DUF4173 domain-containing protein n=1 Tax=Ectorhizobium quercum TaxID=2965071 RepID=A0AAE3N268_9HYPH|nr:DUF4173 domain-containing protein [Ectorhizobium quercum]MCX8997920.1 DUF4173 domain-containing protein [Ectorhizobium quercum]